MQVCGAVSKNANARCDDFWIRRNEAGAMPIVEGGRGRMRMRSFGQIATTYPGVRMLRGAWHDFILFDML